MHRRHFLQSTLATGVLPTLALAQRQPDPKPSEKPQTDKPRKLNILILGGTGFLGPAIVEAALKDGHSLTLFNRGQREKTKGTFFEGAEHLYGNRDPNKYSDDPAHTDEKAPKGLIQIEEAIKAGKTWDVVIDTSGQAPRIVNASAALLAAAAKSYVFISTVSVYAHNDKPNEDESAELAVLTPEQAALPVAELEDLRKHIEHYGPLKVLCEKEAEKAFPGRALIIRPGYIVGVRDDSDRFTYWPVRTTEGPELLTPGDPKDPVQYIDVRDLADFILRCVTSETRGTFNVTSAPMPWGDIVAACTAAAKATKHAAAAPVWIPNEWLADNGLEGGTLPIYIPPEGEYAGFHQRNVKKAIAAGMTIRPTVETCKELLTWWPSESERRKKVAADFKREGKKVSPADEEGTLRVGPPKARTDELLKKWHDEQAWLKDHNGEKKPKDEKKDKEEKKDEKK
jgi:2'-hydroxyisoflavone reductase